MNAVDPTTRYRDYLATFGITEPRDRVAEMRDLDLGDVRYFAYDSGDGLRLKSAVTPRGIVRPGGQSEDDWYGFLKGLPDAASGAERIAWLDRLVDADSRPAERSDRCARGGSPASGRHRSSAVGPRHRPDAALRS